MDRRGFLGSILALGAAPAIVRAESLMSLWVPPAVIVPGNQILTIDMITRQALRILSANLQFTNSLNRDFDDSVRRSAAKMVIRKANKYINFASAQETIWLT